MIITNVINCFKNKTPTPQTHRNFSFVTDTAITFP